MAQGDPFPSISEAQAEGETASIYADIRATLQVPLVNMVWRALAAVPGALPWAWGSVRPLYRSGAASAAARRLRCALAPVSVSPIGEAALRARGIDAAAERQIRRTIVSYADANLINAVTLAALRVMPEGRDLVPSPVEPLPETTRSPERGDGLPSLVSLSTMTQATAERVRKVSALGCEPGVREVQVSLPRQLAHWPGFLALWLEAFSAAEQDGALRVAVVSAVGAVEISGRELAAGSTALAWPLDTGERSRATAIIEAIVPRPLGRMLVIVEGLREALGEGWDHSGKSGAEERT